MPTKTKLPTKSQAATIAYFACRPFAEKVRVNEVSYEKCRQNGWIERTDEFPYHQATPDGVAALDAYEKANRASIGHSTVMDLVRDYGQACYLHSPNTTEARQLLAQIEQALTGKKA